MIFLTVSGPKLLRQKLSLPWDFHGNLNLIERIWKLVKKKCLYAHYYEKFLAFKTAISKCLDDSQFAALLKNAICDRVKYSALGA